MRILVTNDDGIQASGLKAIEEIAHRLSNSVDSVLVVAPQENQSAKSNSITYNEPFKIKKLNETRYAVEGTPTDCVIFAMDHLMKENKPDLILSGINNGFNLSEDVFYSGTVGAAIEGGFRGVLSIAISQSYNSTTMGEKNIYDFAKKHAPDICLKLYNAFHDSSDNQTPIFNVNFPVEPIKNYPNCVKPVKVGRRARSNFVCRKINTKADLITAEISSHVENRSQTTESDYMTCLSGYVTISPLSSNLNHEMHLGKLKDFFGSDQ